MKKLDKQYWLVIMLLIGILFINYFCGDYELYNKNINPLLWGMFGTALLLIPAFIKMDKENNNKITEKQLDHRLSVHRDQQKQTYDQAQQNFKLEFERINKILENDIYYLQNAQLKRINAINELWLCVIEFKTSLPNISLYLSIITEKEISYSNFSGITMFNKLSIDIFHSFTTIISAIGNRAENVRPFISNDLYKLWRTYFTTVGRIYSKFFMDYQLKKLTSWKQDDLIKKELSKILEDVEMKSIYNFITLDVSRLTDILDAKIINVMQKSILGHDFKIDGMDYASLNALTPNVLQNELGKI